jgi:hypothetical protein
LEKIVYLLRLVPKRGSRETLAAAPVNERIQAAKARPVAGSRFIGNFCSIKEQKSTSPAGSPVRRVLEQPQSSKKIALPCSVAYRNA